MKILLWVIGLGLLAPAAVLAFIFWACNEKVKAERAWEEK